MLPARRERGRQRQSRRAAGRSADGLDPPPAAQLPRAAGVYNAYNFKLGDVLNGSSVAGQHDGHGDDDRRLSLPVGPQPGQRREPRRRLQRARSRASTTRSTPGSTGQYAGGPSTAWPGGWAATPSTAAGSTLASITDGTSNTAAFSEWVKGKSARTLRARTWSTRSPATPTAATQNDSIALPGRDHPALGLQGGVLDPPGHRPGRSLLPRHDPEQARLRHRLAASASSTRSSAPGSFHPGGVNVLLMDGSVRFIKDGVTLSTWNALGTRAGSEVISSDSMF